MNISRHAQPVFWNEGKTVPNLNGLRVGGAEPRLECRFGIRVVNDTIDILVVMRLQRSFNAPPARPIDIAVEAIKSRTKHITIGAREINFIVNVGLKDGQGNFAPTL